MENDLFDKSIASTKKSIKRSILSNTQTVVIQEIDENKIGCIIYFTYQKSIRLYSIGIAKEFQSMGYGKSFMKYLFEQAELNGKHILLEVDSNNIQLVSFYQNMGFTITKELIDYYGEDRNGYKMIKKYEYEENLPENLIIADHEVKWANMLENSKIIRASEYLSNNKYAEYKGKIFNLCDSYKYQSMGYYVSLLATARESRIIPNVTTIKDFKNKVILRSIAEEIDEIIQEELKGTQLEKFTIRIYFGLTKNSKFVKLAKQLYNLFETPFLEVEFGKYEKWLINKAVPFSSSSIQKNDYEFVNQCANRYFSQKRSNKQKLKNYIYDLAILVNKDETTPPSNKKALQLFQKAAQEIGFYVEFITKKDYHRITEFDALFIRETTNVNDYTYDFARYAYSEGLFVLDDPWSILKCSNKIYLYERFRKSQILMPKTEIIYSTTFKNIDAKKLSYPLILKKPDSAFSLGVYKVNNEEAFLETTKHLFSTSQMIISQEFIKSDYDWRIGILNNAPIFACKYYMAKGHWQIYDWNNKIESEGDSETIPLSKVPKNVINTAIKSAALIGNGFYGVDLKEVDNKVYVIEVNDNPNIDFGVEDAVEGYDLYKRIMSHFFNNIEYERNSTRYVSLSK